MAETLARMGWTFPSEGDDPWFNGLKQFFQQLDAAGFAYSENTNVIPMSGGIFSFVASTNQLTWGTAIELSSFTSGFTASITAGSLTITDGQVLYVDMPRGLTQNTTITLNTAAKLAASSGKLLHDKIAIGIRRGTRIIFRNGVVLVDGVSQKVFEDPFIAVGALHQHTTEKQVATGGETQFTIAETSPTLLDLKVYKNGARLSDPEDIGVTLSTGVITLVVTAVLNDVYLFDKVLAV